MPRRASAPSSRSASRPKNDPFGGGLFGRDDREEPRILVDRTAPMRSQGKVSGPGGASDRNVTVSGAATAGEPRTRKRATIAAAGEIRNMDPVVSHGRRPATGLEKADPSSSPRSPSPCPRRGGGV